MPGSQFSCSEPWPRRQRQPETPEQRLVFSKDCLGFSSSFSSSVNNLSLPRSEIYFVSRIWRIRQNSQKDVDFLPTEPIHVNGFLIRKPSSTSFTDQGLTCSYFLQMLGRGLIAGLKVFLGDHLGDWVERLDCGEERTDLISNRWVSCCETLAPGVLIQNLTPIFSVKI